MDCTTVKQCEPHCSTTLSTSNQLVPYTPHTHYNGSSFLQLLNSSSDKFDGEESCMNHTGQESCHAGIGDTQHSFGFSAMADGSGSTTVTASDDQMDEKSTSHGNIETVNQLTSGKYKTS